jgi:hypothetical protein
VATFRAGESTREDAGLTDGISVDVRPDVAVEMLCRVEQAEGEEARLVPLFRPRWRAVLSRLAGRTVVVRIIRTKKRSLAQNRLLWHVYEEVLRELRKLAADVDERCPFRDAEELHETMKYVLIGPTVRRFQGTELEIPASSRELTVEQFSAYVSGIVGFWAKRGIYIEMPEGE